MSPESAREDSKPTPPTPTLPAEAEKVLEKVVQEGGPKALMAVIGAFPGRQVLARTLKPHGYLPKQNDILKNCGFKGIRLVWRTERNKTIGIMNSDVNG